MVIVLPLAQYTGFKMTTLMVLTVSSSGNSDRAERQWHPSIVESNTEQAGPLPLYSLKHLKNMFRQKTKSSQPSLISLLNFPFSEPASVKEPSSIQNKMSLTSYLLNHLGLLFVVSHRETTLTKHRKVKVNNSTPNKYVLSNH